MLRLSCLLAAAAAVRDAEADMDGQLQMFGYCKLVRWTLGEALRPFCDPKK